MRDQPTEPITQRLLARLPDPQLWAVLAAVCAGILGALSVWSFHWLLMACEELLYGTREGLVAAARTLPAWQRIVIPTLGALLGGLVLCRFKSRDNNEHAGDFIEAVTIRDGKLNLWLGSGKVLACFLVVVSGGSIGREGAMVLLAALLCSYTGQFWKDRVDLRLVVACGVAAGFTAAYHAPLASSLFIAEVLLGSLALSAIGPVILAATTSALLMQAIDGPGTLYQLASPLALQQPTFWMIGALALIAGLAGPLFLIIMAGAHRLFEKIPLPLPARFAIGGLLVGLISVYSPQAWGNGYSTVQVLLTSAGAWQMVLFIMVCKILATSATTGSGVPGGVLTPTLCIGASFGVLMSQWLGHFAGGGSALTLAGMGVFLAATTHAPIMSALMVLEMTGQPQLLIAVLPACVIAAALARRVRKESVYSGHH